VQLLAKLLRPPGVVSHLDLSDNKIDERGGRHLARALKGNECLVELRLRLNELGDEGGRALLEGGVRGCPGLATLDLCANK